MPAILRSLRISVLLLCALPALALTDPELAPGVPAPKAGTVVLVDTTERTPTPLVVHASEIKSNSHAGGNFGRSAVYVGPKTGVELAGQHSTASVRTNTPGIYVRLSGDEPELQRNRVSLLMLRVNKDSREVMQFSRNVFGGQNKRTMEEIAVTKTDVLASTWLTLTPASPLEPGEYGIVFMPKDKLLFADAVYDFSIAVAK